MHGPQRLAFWILCGAMGLVTLTLATVATAVPLYAVALGLDAATVGLLVALPNVFPMLLAVPAGRAVDGAGALRWMLVASLGLISAPLLVAVLGGTLALVIAQLLLGLFHVFLTLASQAYVATLGSRASFERDFAWYSTSLAAGRLGGPLLAGIVIDAAGFRPAFAVVTVALVLSAVLVSSLRRVGAAVDAPTPDAHAARARVAAVGERSGTPRSDGAAARSRAAPPPTRDGPWALLGNVGLQLAVLSSAGVFVAIAVRQAFLPVYLSELAYSATSIGALLSLGGLAAVLVRPVMPLLSRSLGGPARTLVLAMAAVAVGVGLTGLVSAYAAIAALTVLAGLGAGVGLPLSIVTVASHVDPRRRGTALGVRLSLNRVAQLAAPVAVGAVVAASGFALGFALAGGVLAALALLAAGRVRAFEAADALDESRAMP